MSWQDRLREAAYTSPSGERFLFDYEDVSVQLDRKTSAFDFPDADGTYVQDTGTSSRRYPLRLFIWGADYDRTAKQLLDALAERGPGILEHPLYGQKTVIPFGRITRRDDLKTAANQAVIDVTFWATIELVYPTAQGDAAAETRESVDATTAETAAEFAGKTDLDGTLEQATLRGKIESLVGKAEDGLQGVADTVDDVRREFTAIKDSIDASVDTLVGEPLDLAFQVTQLLHAPARAAASIQDRLSAYGDLASSIIDGEGADTSNEFLSENVQATGATTGAVLSALETDYATRGEALRTAEQVLRQFDDVKDWRDERFAAFDLIDTGASYQRLQESVARLAGYLVELSFDLEQERAVVLDRPRTIVDLSAELYGEVDARLDFLINTNSLTGSEILELPAGKRVVYYA